MSQDAFLHCWGGRNRRARPHPVARQSFFHTRAGASGRGTGPVLDLFSLSRSSRSFQGPQWTAKPQSPCVTEGVHQPDQYIRCTTRQGGRRQHVSEGANQIPTTISSLLSRSGLHLKIHQRVSDYIGRAISDFEQRISDFVNATPISSKDLDFRYVYPISPTHLRFITGSPITLRHVRFQPRISDLSRASPVS